jgi:hypothetical protein
MAAKKSKKSAPTNKKSASKAMNKSQFIRDNPTLSTADLIAKAKKQGVELSSAFIYTLRSSDKHKKVPSAKVKVSGGREGNALAAAKTSGGAEQELERLVKRIGTDRASEVFQRVLKRVLG